MKARFKINETLLMGIVAIIALICFAIWMEPARDNFRCPNDYDTAEEYIDPTAKWIRQQMDKTPGITTNEMIAKREKQFIENGCEASRWMDDLVNTDESSEGIKSQQPQDIQVSTSTKDPSSEFYSLPAEDRNQMLAELIYAGEYQVVVSVTDDGIEMYRDLIWEDIDFWIHRGVAFYQLGNCAESKEALNHVLTIDKNDNIANSLMEKIANEGCKTPIGI